MQMRLRRRRGDIGSLMARVLRVLGVAALT
jgi:hypothetical protein